MQIHTLLSSALVGPILAGSLTPPLLPAQTEWRSLTPMHTPGPRSGHAMTYDAANDRIVLFGGFGGLVVRNDTWLFDGNDWTLVSPTNSPTPRLRSALAYDPGRGRVVLFGGRPGVQGLLGDTWEWDGTDWTQRQPPTQPAPRDSHSLFYFPPRGTVVMYGGDNRNDLWEFDGLDWSPIQTIAHPPPRLGTQAAYDPVGGGILLFGGYLTPTDTWYFDGVDWTQHALTPAPQARFDHRLSTDLLRGRVVLLGGQNPPDTWEWNGTVWLDRQPPTNPPFRQVPGVAFDQLRSRTILFGGLGVAGSLGDMWEYVTLSVGHYGTFGSGCAGSNGLAPRLASDERPWVGETFHATVGPLLPGAWTAMLAGFSNTSWAGGSLPYGLAGQGLPGCDLWIDPVVAIPVPNPGGTADWSLVLPAGPALVGVRFFHQAISLDPAAPGGAVLSDAGDGTIGAK